MRGKRHRIFILLLFASSLLGCSRAFLGVEQQPLNCRRLASAYVKTPDPERVATCVGEELLLSWNLPQLCGPTYLRLHLRFRNRESAVELYQIKKPKGMVAYRLLFSTPLGRKRKGIATYRCELLQGKELLAEVNHHLWREWIHVAEE